MTNLAAICMYLTVLLINTVLLCSIFLQKEKSYMNKIFICLSLLLIGWQVFELLFYMLHDARKIEFVFLAKYAVISFVSPLFLFLIAGFYRLNRQIPLWVKMAMLCVPAFTALCAITGTQHNLFFTDFSLLSASPLTRISYSWGPVYFLHMGYSQVPVLLIAYIALTQNKKLPAEYRTGGGLLFAGMLISIAGFIPAAMAMHSRPAPDYQLLSISASCFLAYIAMSSNGRADYLHIWRQDIFGYLDEPVLILDGKGQVADANKSAAQLLRGLGVDAPHMPIAELRKKLVSTGNASFRAADAGDGPPGEEDLYITTGKYPVIYHVQRRQMTHGAIRLDGEYICLTEVTRNRLLLERVRDTAGIDPLTGLRNRFSHETMLRALDTPEQFPLSIVFGDINGLKETNDVFGHQTGDAVIAAAAEILSRACPQGGYVARIGGDEFIMVLPRCPAQAAQEIVRRIQADMHAAGAGAPPVSMALGCATKANAAQNINNLIRHADADMYSQKQAKEMRL